MYFRFHIIGQGGKERFTRLPCGSYEKAEILALTKLWAWDTVIIEFVKDGSNDPNEVRVIRKEEKAFYERVKEVVNMLKVDSKWINEYYHGATDIGEDLKGYTVEGIKIDLPIFIQSLTEKATPMLKPNDANPHFKCKRGSKP
jgi:hypothetical protein